VDEKRAAVLDGQAITADASAPRAKRIGSGHARAKTETAAFVHDSDFETREGRSWIEHGCVYPRVGNLATLP
jgi:hypothetical protein